MSKNKKRVSWQWLFPPGLCFGNGRLYIYGFVRETLEPKFEFFSNEKRGEVQKGWQSLPPIPKGDLELPSHLYYLDRILPGKLIYVEEKQRIYSFGVAKTKNLECGFIYDTKTEKWSALRCKYPEAFFLHKPHVDTKPTLVGNVIYFFPFCEREESHGTMVITFDCVSSEWKTLGTIPGIESFRIMTMEDKIGLFAKMKGLVIILNSDYSKSSSSDDKKGMKDDAWGENYKKLKKLEYSCSSFLILVLPCLEDKYHLVKSTNIDAVHIFDFKTGKDTVHVFDFKAGKMETERNKNKVCTLWPNTMLADWNKFIKVYIPMKDLFDLLSFRSGGRRRREEKKGKQRKPKIEPKSRPLLSCTSL